MKKSIVTIIAFTLFALASISAQAADIVIVRVRFLLKETVVHIYQNGNVIEKKYPLYTATTLDAYTKDLGDLLMIYYKEGYKLITSASFSDGREYILDKD
jgi:hypothetical protein